MAALTDEQFGGTEAAINAESGTAQARSYPNLESGQTAVKSSDVVVLENEDPNEEIEKMDEIPSDNKKRKDEIECNVTSSKFNQEGSISPEAGCDAFTVEQFRGTDATKNAESGTARARSDPDGESGQAGVKINNVVAAENEDPSIKEKIGKMPSDDKKRKDEIECHVPSSEFNQEVSISPEARCDAKESKTQNRTSLRQRSRIKSIPEKPIEPPPPAPAAFIKEKLPPVERPINWFEGDLVWSLVSGHPLWPCVVTFDPESRTYTKMKGTGPTARRTYHVQFFGDSPEIAWINESRVYKFDGEDGYKSLVQTIAKKILKRPPKVEVSSRFIQNWTAGIKEIGRAIPMTRDERIKKFTFDYINNVPRKPVLEMEKKEKDRSKKRNDKKTNERDDGGSKKIVSAPEKTSKDEISPTEKDLGTRNGLHVRSNNLNSVAETLDFVVKKYTMTSDETQLSNTAKGNALRNKILTAKKSYACLYCQDIYFSVTEMRQHYKEKHPESEEIYSKSKTSNLPKAQQQQICSPDANSSNEVSCHVCGERFGNKRCLGQHRRFSHSYSDSLVQVNHTNLVSEKQPSIPKDLITIPVPLNKTKLDTIPIPVVPSRARSRPPLSSQKKDPVCVICGENGDTLTCSADCYRSFHAACLSGYDIDDPFVCKECKTGKHACILCNKPGSNISGLGELKRCVVALCGRYFHSTCLQIYKLKGTTDVTDKALGSGPNTRCPSHSCTTCTSKAIIENTRSGEVHLVKAPNRNRLFKCIRCPTAYHVAGDCVAAGSILLGGLNILCPAHFKPMKTVNHHHPVHISWCFVCSKGGELICCAACPAAFHPRCIDLEKPPEGDWHCLDCSCGIRPLYDDVVWVKLGTYRWWPGQVTHPNDIPDNISRLQHGPGEFVVKFFGSNDYFWLSRCRVFLYQEGDNGATTRHCSRGISGVFKKALQEAEETFRVVTTARQLQEEVKIAENGKKPAPYRHIKYNKPVGNVQIYAAALGEIAKCTCRRTDPHPCGAESECLNRMLMYECHPSVCPAGDRCDNQRFQKCEYPPTEVFKTEWGGWGLKIKDFIKKGSFVNEYVGELVDEEECKRRIETAHDKNVTNFYMLTIDKDRIIDAGPKGNLSRFMNHCCGPNCETQKWTVNGDTRVGLFALRDIMPGEELTFNYNLDCRGNDKTKCMCGSENCSGFIGVRPKVQMDGVKRERKKKRKYCRYENLPQHDDFCFRCRQTGTLVCCDFKGCLRAFCLECLHIEKPPYGKWECPCHHCDWCGRRAQYFCSFCPNSFCASHVKNQLQPSIPNQFDTCTDHEPQKAEFEMAEVVAMVNELMNTPLDELQDDSANSTLSTASPKNIDSAQEEPNGVSIGQKRRRKPSSNKQAKRSKKVSDSG